MPVIQLKLQRRVMVGHGIVVVMVCHGGDLSKSSQLLSPCNRAQATGLAWPSAASGPGVRWWVKNSRELHPMYQFMSSARRWNFKLQLSKCSHFVSVAWKNHLRLSNFWVTGSGMKHDELWSSGLTSHKSTWPQSDSGPQSDKAWLKDDVVTMLREICQQVSVQCRKHFSLFVKWLELDLDRRPSGNFRYHLIWWDLVVFRMDC